VTGARVPRALGGLDAGQMVAALYHAHYRSLLRIAALLAGDGAEAERIVQDAFVSMHRAWRRLRDGDAAIGDLHRAVVTRARGRGAASLDPPGISGEEVLIAALRSLSARQREALILKYYTDWPDPQIAAAMGTSEHALNGHIRCGMSVLRELTGDLAACGRPLPKGRAMPAPTAGAGSDPEDEQAGGGEGGRPG
jgi:DNA-directed RNA polymerase specialized sigma24 family protein